MMKKIKADKRRNKKILILSQHFGEEKINM
jgi:hypothetical protein